VATGRLGGEEVGGNDGVYYKHDRMLYPGVTLHDSVCG
jgi:hypothetical protein